MKKKNYALRLLLISALAVLSLSMFGCEKKASGTEAVAKNFLEGTFVVQNYDNCEKLDELMNSNDIALDESDSSSIGTFSEEVNKQIEQLSYGKVEKLITDNLKTNGTLVLDRICPIRYEIQAQSEGYTTSIKSIDLEEVGTTTETAKNYSYTLVIEVKHSDNTVEEKKVSGNLNLIKEKDSWLVDYFKVS